MMKQRRGQSCRVRSRCKDECAEWRFRLNTPINHAPHSDHIKQTCKDNHSPTCCYGNCWSMGTMWRHRHSIEGVHKSIQVREDQRSLPSMPVVRVSSTQMGNISAMERPLDSPFISITRFDQQKRVIIDYSPRVPCEDD